MAWLDAIWEGKNQMRFFGLQQLLEFTDITSVSNERDFQVQNSPFKLAFKPVAWVLIISSACDSVKPSLHRDV